MLEFLRRYLGKATHSSHSACQKAEPIQPSEPKTISDAEKSTPKPDEEERHKKKLRKGPDSCYLEDGRCYRCGKPSVEGCFEPVNLYGNLRVGAKYPEVLFDRRVLKMPLCESCSHEELEPSWGFMLYVQEKAKGWDVGDGPSKERKELVWKFHQFNNGEDEWSQAIRKLECEQEQKRIKELHIFDKPVAVIDQFEILQRLGEGGFGAVFLARDTVSKTLVAIKGLPREINRHQAERENLRKNFALITRLHHPNVASPLVLHPAEKVQYLDDLVESMLQIHKGDFFLVMEYARGKTLMEWCRSLRQFDLTLIGNVVEQIAQALDYAHSLSILHRDIKPNNILVNESKDGKLEVKVLDFGLAAELKMSMNRLECEPVGVSGTLPYMAPEQWRGEKQGVGTDVYSLSVVAFELLQGTVPFASAFKTGDTRLMYSVVLNAEEEYPRGIWREMREVLHRGLAKKARNRYFSCADFANAFNAAIKAYLNREITDNHSSIGADHKETNTWDAAVGDLYKKQYMAGFSVIGVSGQRERNFFWERIKRLLLNIEPSRLIHSNEILALNFSLDKDSEEQLIYEVSEELKNRFGTYYFKNIWEGVIRWTKLMSELILKFDPHRADVYASALAWREKHNKFELSEKNRNVPVTNRPGETRVFLGNPFYIETIGVDTVLCDYYIAKHHVQ